MNKHFLYLYRLTDFNGTAPCYDNDLLSLAICKTDMRRVIGRNWLTNSNDIYWFVGIVGSRLANNGKSGFTKSDINRILYIAKVNKVEKYEDYFTNSKYANRSDQIYVENKNGKYHSLGSSRLFNHVSKNISETHLDKESQDRDWDVKYGSKETFVLISEEYAFLNAKSSEKIKELFDKAKIDLPKKQGHKWFEYNNDSPIAKLFDEILEEADKRGINNLPMFSQCNCNKNCRKG